MGVISGYLSFLRNKTEEEVIDAIASMLKRSKFKEIDKVKSLKKGDRVYFRRGNFLAAAIIGEDTSAARIVVSHVDAPRIDLKPAPFVEKDGYVYLKTHYYGGLKVHHWIAIPLEIRGRVYTQEGQYYSVSIPTIITDFAPHLAKDWKDKKVGDAFDPDKLEPIVALGPKSAVLDKIRDEFGVEEGDFLSADLKLVPKVEPEVFGANREFIMAYGHDDRVSVYTSLRALVDAKYHPVLSIAFFVDREEVGSTTGESAASALIEYFLLKLLEKTRGTASMKDLLELFVRSSVISADVTAGYDPLYSELYDKENAPKLGSGVVVSKYTGVGPKYNGSEASASYVAWIRRVFDANEVIYQAGTLGKAGKAGGATVALYFARRGARVVDIGPPVLSMHAPAEVVAKIDVESAYRAYKSFYEWVD